MNPNEYYWHGTYDAESLRSIVNDGLKENTSISSAHGQATGYPIILQLPGNIRAESVSYRPEDFFLLDDGAKPIAMYVIPQDYGKPVRSIDEINVELAEVLKRLEEDGIATPEQAGALMGDYPAMFAIDRKLGELGMEMDSSLKRELRGLPPTFVGGEGILEGIAKMGLGIPIYRLQRDEEGEVDWESATLM